MNLLLNIIVSILIVIYFVLFLKNLRKNSDVLKELAKKRNGTINKDSNLVFQYKNINVLVSISPADPIQILLIVNSQFNIHGRIVIYKKDILNAFDFKFLYRDLRDIQLGNSEFNKKFWIGANDENYVYRLLTPEIQNKLIETRDRHLRFTRYSLKVDIQNNRYIFDVRGRGKSFREIRDYDDIIDTAINILDRIKEF